MRRRFQTGEVLDSGVAFGAGRLGPSEVAPGPVPLPFHGPYIAQEMVSRSSPGVLRHEEIRRNMSAVMKTASGSAAGDSGHCPQVSRVMHDAGTYCASCLSLESLYRCIDKSLSLNPGRDLH
jgi:hypothetical protein